MKKRKNNVPDPTRRNANLRDTKRCPYCGSKVRFVSADELKALIYKQRREKTTPFICNHKHYYVCSNFDNCQSYIGAYETTYDPMGVIANKELRLLRIQTHLIFDEIWKKNILEKDEAYSLLSDSLYLSRGQTHISQFNKHNCEKTIEIAKKILQNHGIPIPDLNAFFAKRAIE